MPFTAAGQARDTNGNIQFTDGPTLSDTTAAPDAPAPPTGISAKYGVDGGGPGGLASGFAKFAFTPSGYARIGMYEWELFTTDAGRLYYTYGTLAATADSFVVESLPVGRGLRLLMRTVSIGGLRGPDSTPYNFTIGPVPVPVPPDFEQKDPTATDPDTALPGAWAGTLTGDGAAALYTATVFGGTRSVQLSATTGTAQIESVPWIVRPSAVYAVDVTHDGLFTTGTLLITVRWFDKDSVFISASTVYNAAPSAAALPTSITVTAPSTATQAVWRYHFTGAGTLNAVVIGPPMKWRRLAETIDYGAGTVTVPILNLRTESAAALPIYDENGANETTLYVDSASHDFTLTTSDGVQLILGLGTAAITEDITLENVTAGNIDAGGNVAVGVGALTGTVSQTGNGSAAELHLATLDDEYGNSHLYLRNTNNINGALFFAEYDDTSIRLIDFVFRWTTPGGTDQRNIRIEDRSPYVFTGGNPEWQIGNPGDPDFCISAAGIILRRGHLAAGGSAPSIAAGTGAGSSPTLTLTGNDVRGVIELTAGLAPTLNGDICTVTFNTVFLAAPAVVVTPASAKAAADGAFWYVDFATVSTSIWRLKNQGTALTASGVYKWYYHVLG